jgi:AdoMet-dependent heme synthase
MALQHGGHAPRDYSQTPMNIYWEMTQACALTCRHCRAEAMPGPNPMQLTFEESLQFLRQIPEFGNPLPQLILTGGDPLERKDLLPLIDEARRLGIGTSITPAATPAFTRDVLVTLKEHGVEGLGLSLDGSTPEKHDSIRGVPGTFERTMNAIRWAQELEMPLQVNTLVAEETAGDIPAIYELLKPYAVSRWSLFFLISVGRGKVLQALSPQEGEKLMGWAFETSRTAPFVIATTEAPSYRRVVLERMRAEGMSTEEIKRTGVYRSFEIRDGHGIMFVSNTGEVCPAGFLPVVVGNVQKDRVVDLYRNAPLFRSLHNPKQFEGRCGICEYNALCGGSRSRAFGATSNPLATDPLCDYIPHSTKAEPGGEKK